MSSARQQGHVQGGGAGPHRPARTLAETLSVKQGSGHEHSVAVTGQSPACASPSKTGAPLQDRGGHREVARPGSAGAPEWTRRSREAYRMRRREMCRSAVKVAAPFEKRDKQSKSPAFRSTGRRSGNRPSGARRRFAAALRSAACSRPPENTSGQRSGSPRALRPSRHLSKRP